MENKKLITFIFILFGLIMIALGAYVFFLSRKEEEPRPPFGEMQSPLIFRPDLPEEEAEEIEKNGDFVVYDNEGNLIQGRERDLPERESERPSQRQIQESGSQKGKNAITTAVINTGAGEKYGIDIEGIVKFLNSSATVRKVLAGYESVNLVFTTTNGNINLVARLNTNGSIKEVSDGSDSGADFTLKAPLSDVQDVINNAENLNALSVLGLLKNLEITPANAKTELLSKII